MFTTVKSLTAKYLLATLLVSGVFFGFSQVALAADSGTPALVTEAQSASVVNTEVSETVKPTAPVVVIDTQKVEAVLNHQTTDSSDSTDKVTGEEGKNTDGVPTSSQEEVGAGNFGSATSTPSTDGVVASSTVTTSTASSTTEGGSGSSTTSANTDNNGAAVILPPGQNQIEGGYIDGKWAVIPTGQNGIDDSNTPVYRSADASVTVAADPNEKISGQSDTFTDETNQNADEALSDQHDFTTPIDGCTNNCGGTEAVSGQHDFTTNPDTCTVNCTPNEEAVSGQHDFNTPGDTCTTNCGGSEEVVSDQHGFTTLTDSGCTTNCGGNNDESVSDQHDFNTNNDGGGGCVGSCGGGGGCVSGCGGGCISGCGGGIVIPPGGILPPGCKPFLLKFIRYGYNNDPYEVRKLQAFLDIFEGYNLPITGIYDLQTEQAVRAFQSKYAADVLVPWGISDNTGYVFITTMLKINYIYCGITTPIDVDLRSRFPGFEFGPGGLQQIENNFEQPNATPLPVPEVGQGNNLLQLAAAGLLKGLNWLWDHLCWLAWLLVLILLAIIAYLLMRLRELKQRLAKYENPDGGMTEAGSLAATVTGSVVAIPLVDTLTEDDHSVITEPETDNWQDYLEDGPVPVVPVPVAEADVESEPEVSPEPDPVPPAPTAKEADYENDLKALLDALSERNNKGEK